MVVEILLIIFSEYLKFFDGDIHAIFQNIWRYCLASNEDDCTLIFDIL